MSRVHLSSSSSGARKKKPSMPIEMLQSISNPSRLRHDSISVYESDDDADADAAAAAAQAEDEPVEYSAVYTEADDEPVHYEPSLPQVKVSTRPPSVIQRSSSSYSNRPSAPVNVKISRPLPPPVHVEEEFYEQQESPGTERSVRHRRSSHRHKSKKRHGHGRSHRKHSSYAVSSTASHSNSSHQSDIESVKASVPPLYVDREREQHERNLRSSVQDYANFRSEVIRDDEDLEKQELLYRIQQLEKDGYPPSRHMDSNTGIDEVRYELYRLTRDQTRQKSLKWYSQSLITGSRLLEIGNERFDLFGLKLRGFSRNVALNIDDFQGPLAGIHAQYAGRSSTTNPVVQLVMTLLGSLLFHHVSVVTSEESQRTQPLTQTGKVISSLAGGSSATSGIAIKKNNIKSNPFSMLSSIFGGGATTETSTVKQNRMQGPPSEDSASETEQ